MGRGRCHTKSGTEIAAVQSWSASGVQGNNRVHGGERRYDIGSLWEETAHFKLFIKFLFLNKLLYFCVSIHTCTFTWRCISVLFPYTHPHKPYWYLSILNIIKLKNLPLMLIWKSGWKKRRWVSMRCPYDNVWNKKPFLKTVLVKLGCCWVKYNWDVSN